MWFTVGKYLNHLMLLGRDLDFNCKLTYWTYCELQWECVRIESNTVILLVQVP